MGRLAGFSYREVTRRLRKFGFEPSGKQRGSHEGWVNDASPRSTVIPHHLGDMPEGTLRSILRQAGVAHDEFLAD